MGACADATGVEHRLDRVHLESSERPHEAYGYRCWDRAVLTNGEQLFDPWMRGADANWADWANRTQGTDGTNGVRAGRGGLMSGGFIPPHGGYKNLLSYQKAEIVYDATVYFCDRFIDKRSRTHDQMVQAARSGKQNIVEGSMASGTSKETEIKLTNVARASLEELLADYRDFLRVRKLPVWDKNDSTGAEAVRTETRAYGSHGSYATYATYATHIEHPTRKPRPTRSSA